MIDLYSKNDIEKISYEILKGSKSLDVFPTPIDRIVSYAELVVRNDIDVSKIPSDYFSRASDALRRALTKVRGVLDRKERTIYLDLSQNISRRGFVKLHEVGHDVLPWQKKTHELLDDDDDSLNADTSEEFEAEASFFASVTLFQHDRFINEINKLSLGIESPIQLSKYFGASIHATLRRYVECSKNRCALFVLEKITIEESKIKCILRDKFYSVNFGKTFGEIKTPLVFDNSWSFVMDYFSGRRFVKDGFIKLLTNNGEVHFMYHFFNNTYNGFVFLFPVGEKKSSRTNIIIGNPFQK